MKNALLVLLLLASVVEGSVESLSKPAEVSVADYGAVVDDGKDDTIAVVEALRAASKTGGPAVIIFEAGQYDFFKEFAQEAHYPVTAVHLQWDFATPFHLDGLKDITLEGSGARFMMHGRMTPFVLNACERITVRGITIEHARPSVFELRVLNKKDGLVEFQAAQGDQFVVEDNKLWWLDADDKPQVPNVTQAYDPILDTTWRTRNPLDAATTITLIDGRHIQVGYDPNSQPYRSIVEGRSYQFRKGTRVQSGTVIFECSDVTFEDMNIHSWNGLGFVGQFSRNVTLRNLRMEPRAGSGRTSAGFSDGIQMMNCRGRLLIEGCRIIGLHDDHINIYGQMMKLDSIESPQVIRAVYTSGETEGHLNFRPGDQIGFRDAKKLADKGIAKILRAELIDNKTMELEIEGRIPPGELWVENRTWIPDDVIIRNNYFGRVSTRSILMFLAKRAVIENNFFHRIRMQSILLQTPDHRYALQNSVGELKIRNNVFYECSKTLIQSNPQVQELAADANLYGSIEVEGNFVKMPDASPLFTDLRGFDEVVIGPNDIEASDLQATLARLSDCGAVQLEPQNLTGGMTEPKAELKRIGDSEVEGWVELAH